MATIRIIEENFKSIDPGMLLESGRYAEVEAMVMNIDSAYAPDYSKEYALMLADKLDALGNRLPADLAAKYLRLLAALRLHSLITISDEEKERFIRQHILDVLRLDFVNVKDWLEYCLRHYHQAPELVEQVRKAYIKGLEGAVQFLGNNDLKVPTENVPKAPTLANWILDYTHSVGINRIKGNRGPVEEGAYFQQSQNAPQLTVEEKKLLQKVLALYDWLQFSAFKYDFSLPGQKPLAEQQEILPQTAHVLISPDVAEIIKNMRKAGGGRPAATPPRPPVVLPRPVPPPPAPPSRPAVRYAAPDSGQNQIGGIRNIPRPPSPTSPRIESGAGSGPSSGRRGIIYEEPESPPPPPPKPEQVEQLQKLVREANFVSAPSISGAIVNAGQPGGWQPGKMRMGKEERGSRVPEKIASSDKIAPEKVPFSPRREPSQPFASKLSTPKPAPVGEGLKPSTAEKVSPPSPAPKASPPQTLPKAPASPVIPIPPKPTLPSQEASQKPRSSVIPAEAGIQSFSKQGSEDSGSVAGMTKSGGGASSPASPVVDLSKKPIVEITLIASPAELSKITLSDVKSAGFESALNQIKQKIIELSKTQNQPVKQIANGFYRSPFYNLYVSMAVAVMNDVSGDQNTAFDKVLKNYQTAGKEFLTRGEFTAVNRLKKELAGMG